MISFIQENYVWLTPILVALVSSIVAGIFQLMKKNASKNKQTIKKVSNSSINQANGNINVNKQ
jgi:spore maturation protein SpmA